MQELLSPRDEAIQALRLGVRAWNGWVKKKRKVDPEFKPDLRRIDFRDVEWQKTPLWRSTSERTRKHEEKLICLFEERLIHHRNNYTELIITPIDLKGAILFNTHFENVALFKANLEGAALENACLDDAYLCEAHMERAMLYRASLKRADLTLAHLEKASGSADFESAFVSATLFKGSYLKHSNFKKAYLGNAQFEDADCYGMKIEGAILRGADFTRARVENIKYKLYRGWPVDIFPFNQGFWPIKRNLMLGNYLGIRGLDSCYGSPGFRRDALDQDFIDDLFERVRIFDRIQFYKDRGPIVIQSRWFRWPASQKLSFRVQFFLTITSRGYWSRLPVRLAFAMWGFFDYGRSLLSLLIFSALTVGLIGWWYQCLETSNALTFTGNLAEGGGGDAVAQFARPWFAAFMGFATLGVTDLVRANTWVGQFAMAINVLAGFSTLGLFISVFQNKFARRS